MTTKEQVTPPPAPLTGLAWDGEHFRALVKDALDRMQVGDLDRFHERLAVAGSDTRPTPLTPVKQVLMATVIDQHLALNGKFNQAMKEFTGPDLPPEVEDRRELFARLRAS